jgi:hypothetical protein
MIDILETDQEFSDSPNAGDNDCHCSRCGKLIPEIDAPIIRCFTERNTEYRFCHQCCKSMGITYAD